ncbi:23648_t:CDS:2, partial [Dentiscutata erythropus]
SRMAAMAWKNESRKVKRKYEDIAREVEKIHVKLLLSSSTYYQIPSSISANNASTITVASISYPNHNNHHHRNVTRHSPYLISPTIRSQHSPHSPSSTSLSPSSHHHTHTTTVPSNHHQQPQQHNNHNHYTTILQQQHHQPSIPSMQDFTHSPIYFLEDQNNANHHHSQQSHHQQQQHQHSQHHSQQQQNPHFLSYDYNPNIFSQLNQDIHQHHDLHSLPLLSTSDTDESSLFSNESIGNSLNSSP